MSAASELAAMFDADRSVTPAVWFKRFEMYSIDAEIGLKPWHPPASEVWYNQGVPGTDGAPCHRHTGEVWAVLQDLHSQYMEAKTRQVP